MMSRLKLESLCTSLVLLGAFCLWGCAASNKQAQLTRELLSLSKEEAYAKGEVLISKKKREEGRQYLRFVAENYANDPIGKQAALKLADSYFDEKSALGYLEAQARFKDFRNRYPSHPRADYALFRLGLCADRQAEKPDRDQTNTRQAVAAYRELLQAYPLSPYTSEVQLRLTAMRNLLAEHEFRVANFYYRRGFWRAASGRYEYLMRIHGDYPNLDRVLFEAGAVEKKLGKTDEAHTFWTRLKQDFPKSEWVRKLPKDLQAADTAAAPPA